VVERYLECGNRLQDIYAIVNDVMPADDGMDIPEPLLKLAAIHPFKLFVTTNIDSLLEHAINHKRFGGAAKTQVISYTPNEINDLPGSLESLSGPTVYHLFGLVSPIPGDHVLSQEDILEFLHVLQSETYRPKMLFDELSSNNRLFLGCNFADWLTRFFIRTSKSRRLFCTSNNK